MTDIETIIEQRIKLYDTEVAPLMRKTDEELNNSNITITPNQLKTYIEAIGQKSLQLDSELEEHIIGDHSYCCGRIQGMQMMLKLFALMKAPKISFICDDGEDYKCGNCGHRIYKDDNFCPNCGVMLYFEED